MLKTLIKCVRQYKWVSILTPIFISIEVVMETFIVFTIKDLINMMEYGTLADVGKYALILVILALISLICGIANG